ncbi:uncharacterized protein LOC110402684 [Numida meleagris]|uniref:uncharacterized protein LOC110402684 n=1 Tax=Numida meleagris TaxID=8996 RepID=UPI000B3E31BD|nr:uncharacterized protein LOC110402684 [Numida meleagris]
MCCQCRETPRCSTQDLGTFIFWKYTAASQYPRNWILQDVVLRRRLNSALPTAERNAHGNAAARCALTTTTKTFGREFRSLQKTEKHISLKSSRESSFQQPASTLGHAHFKCCRRRAGKGKRGQQNGQEGSVQDPRFFPAPSSPRNDQGAEDTPCWGTPAGTARFCRESGRGPSGSVLQTALSLSFLLPKIGMFKFKNVLSNPQHSGVILNELYLIKHIPSCYFDWSFIFLSCNK